MRYRPRGGKPAGTDKLKHCALPTCDTEDDENTNVCSRLVVGSMRILHTADIHLGTDLYGHYDPLTGGSSRLPEA